jgi:hypothetical protein
MDIDLQSLIVWLLIGGIAGWLAGQIMKGGGFGLVGDIIVGLDLHSEIRSSGRSSQRSSGRAFCFSSCDWFDEGHSPTTDRKLWFSTQC